jgi:hypothetical protein
MLTDNKMPISIPQFIEMNFLKALAVTPWLENPLRPLGLFDLRRLAKLRAEYT